jgi:6-phosphofructokinase 1
MNAAIRAVVRTGISKGLEVFGVQHGYAGLVAGKFTRLGARDVGGIMQRGGTVLGSARCQEFKTEEGRAQALRWLRQQDIEGLICIGGNGTQTGSNALSQMGFPVVGVASTIDNDLFGSDITIGVDTALNIALEAIDRLKVTASSHQRAFLVEVMGRNCGYLALMAALAGGAEAVEIPERETDPEALAKILEEAYARGKPHALVVVAEGAKYNAEALLKYFRENRSRLGFDLRATSLGHTQRGGTPTAFDRLLATRLGSAAVDCMVQGKFGVLVGLHRDGIKTTPLAEVVGKQKPLDPRLLELERILAI